MTGATVAVRRAADDDLPYIARLLSRNGLPTADLPTADRPTADRPTADRPTADLPTDGLPPGDDRSARATFYVASAGGDRIGVGGLERYGADALLRSVAIEAPSRANGYGSALVDALEAAGADDGVETIYLLTTTAAAFFADRGYERIDRDAAPAAIRNTAEFADLCPSSATCMRKRL